MVSFPWVIKQASARPPDFFNRSTEKQRRLSGYKRIWEAYLSELPDPIKIESGSYNDNVKINPIRAIVDVGVYFMFGDEVRFEVSPQRTAQLGINRTSRHNTRTRGPATAPFPAEDATSYASPEVTTLLPTIHSGNAVDSTAGEPGEDVQPSKTDMDPQNPPWLQDLNRTWRANEKMSLLREMGLSGAIHGDVFVKFVPNGAGLNYDLPRIVVLDPANVDIVTHPDDYRRVIKYIIIYNVEDDQGRVVTREQEITPISDEEDEYVSKTTHWEINDYETVWNYDVMAGWYPGASKRTPIGPTRIWPFPWPPIEHCNNMKIPHLFWGLPDVDDSAVEVVQSLQSAMSSLNKVVRLHGSPRLFAKGVMPELAGQIDASPDGVITLPAGAGVDSDLRILEGLTNMDSQISFVENIRKQLFESVQCPAIALGDATHVSGNMTGVNMSILYAPILQKTEVKRISYGDMLTRINHKLLILMGYESPEQYDDLEIIWPEAMPGSEYVERQTFMQDIQLGLSKYTAMQRLGYDPQLEETKRNDELREQLSIESEFLTMQPGSQQVAQNGATTSKVTNTKISGKPGPGGNNNPSGKGNSAGSMGATGNSTPKDTQNPSTPRSRGGGS